MIVDPWSSKEIDYSKIMQEFGISKLTGSVRKFLLHRAVQEKIKLPWLEQDIIFAHRDLDKYIASYKSGQPVAVLTGIKPTGEFHFGSKQVIEELIMFQKIFNAKTYYCIADLEAYSDNGQWIDKTFKTAVSNVADVLALGLDIKNCYIYRQSYEPVVQRCAYYFSRKITNATFRAIYGDKPVSLYMSSLIQIGDILLPQSKEHGGPRHVLIPVGIDQDPHIRLTRDFAVKNGFVRPASSYHYFMKSLDGSQKMSKRSPDSMLTLADSDNDVKRKILKALTGGRDTVQEQKQKGGIPDKCMVLELLKFHGKLSADDVNKRAGDCASGRLTCGECKEYVIKKIISYIKLHRKKKKRFIPLANEIVGQGMFDGASRQGRKIVKQFLKK